MESIPIHVHVHQVILMQTAMLQSITVHLSLARMEEHALMEWLHIDASVQLVILVLIVNSLTIAPPSPVKMEEPAQMELILTLVLVYLATLVTIVLASSIIVSLNHARMEEPAEMELIPTPVHAHLVSLTVTAIPSSTTVFLSHARMEEPAQMESTPTCACAHLVSLIATATLL